jgi:hypothetical protein
MSNKKSRHARLNTTGILLLDVELGIKSRSKHSAFYRKKSFWEKIHRHFLDISLKI